MYDDGRIWKMGRKMTMMTMMDGWMMRITGYGSHDEDG